MSVFYLVAIPWLTGLLLFPLRRFRWLTSILAALAMGATCFVCLNLPTDQTQWLLGRPLLWDSLARNGLLLVFASMGTLYLYGIRAIFDEIVLPLSLIIGGLLALTVLYRTFVMTVLLLESIGVIGALLIPRKDPESAHTAMPYLFVSILATPVLLLASWFMDQYLLNPDEIQLTQLTASALALGFAILLGGFPFHVWLPPVAQSASALVTGLLTGPLNIVVLTSFVRVLSRYSWLGSSTRVWSTLEVAGVLAAVIGGLLAYSAESIGRLWAYAAVADLGFILVGLASSSEMGLMGGLFQAVVRCVATVLISMSVSTIRAHSRYTDNGDLRGLARRFPLTFIGLATGGMSLAGVPPTAGFVGHSLILRGLSSRGSGPLLILALVGSIGMAWGYLRALGSALSEPGPGARSREPLLPSLVILSVSLVLLAIGMYPSPLISLVQSLARALAWRAI